MVSFKNTLLDILNSNSNEAGKAAKTTIMASYTWDKSVNILKKMYKDLT